MNKSESINELALALSKLQGEITDPSKNKKGYGYDYADLPSILDIVRPLLQKYELSVMQLCGDASEFIKIETVLMHKSGQWISSEICMKFVVGKDRYGKDLNHTQAAGSIISYARRYALAAFLGITQTDNDGAFDRDEVSNSSPSKPNGNGYNKYAETPIKQKVNRPADFKDVSNLMKNIGKNIQELPKDASGMIDLSVPVSEKVCPETFADFSKLIISKGIKSEQSQKWMKEKGVNNLKDLKEVDVQSLIEKLILRPDYVKDTVSINESA